MAMRFRQLKNNARIKVGVFRSLIHGRGLFCIRELEQTEMVIEYAGEVSFDLFICHKFIDIHIIQM
jgi:[histone H3]-lysine4 N-trimethyltransferase MLL1